MHYHFVDEAAFEELVRQDAFLEHARVFDNRYGTGRAQVEAQLEAGHDVLLDIDWQGARQVRAAFPACRGVFILPPSMAILRQRLAAAVIERRMRDARSEISHWDEFDHVVVNDNFEAALADLQAIVRDGAPLRGDQQDRTEEILADFLGTG